MDAKHKVVKDPTVLKKGLPKETIEFVKKIVLEQRPKDAEAKIDLEYVNNTEIRDALLEFEAKDPLVKRTTIIFFSVNISQIQLFFHIFLYIETKSFQCWIIVCKGWTN